MTRNVVYSLGLLLTMMVWSGCGEDSVLNLEPEFTDGTNTYTVIESIGDDEVIATLMAEDNEGQGLTFGILLNDNGLFEVDATTGELSLSTGAELDYESARSHTIAVSVTDQRGLSEEMGITIVVTDDTDDNVKADFDFADSTAYEGGAGIVDITITLSEVILVEGASVVVNITSDAVYGEDYVTEPAATAGVVEVPVAIGQTATSFSIQPLDDLVTSDDITYTFAIDNGADNIIVPGSTTATSAFTEANDDDGNAYFVMNADNEDFSTLYSVSPISGVQSPYLDLTFDGAPLADVRSMDYDASAQLLYVNTGGEDIYSVDLTTGEATAIIGIDTLDIYGSNDVTPTGSSLEVIDGSIYSILRTFDPVTSAATFYWVEHNLSTGVTTGTASDFPDFCYGLGYIGDKLYAAAQSFTFGYGLFEMDLATGQMVDGALDISTPSAAAEAFITSLGGDLTRLPLQGVDANFGLYNANPGDFEHYPIVFNADGTFDFMSETPVAGDGNWNSCAVVAVDDLP